ncbi:helix-turn-helix transcriptional regulator [Aurantiacibacter sp. MUD61]|uniref:helix-turn-helix transcriptional regulator n=1 Tax=Aurantiacibacter sp. MUD61 TaxID=3009083 RepID=UPI0022F0930C|nr:hypothetical protein [Aurantiacibacter sp. MUD61]
MAGGAELPDRLVKSVEAAGFGDASWADVLETLAHSVGGVRGILLGGSGAARYSYSCIFNHDPDVAKAYNRHYNRFDPRAQPSLRVAVGQTRLGQELMPNSAISHTEYYAAISEAGDIADSVFGVISNDPEMGRRTISLQRSFSQDFFDTRDALLLKALLPLLGGAMRSSLRVGRILAEERGDETILYGLVDSDLSLTFLPGSEPDSPMLTGPLRFGRDRLTCGLPALRNALIAAIAEAQSARSTTVRAGAVSLRFDPVPSALHWYRSGRTQVFFTLSRDSARAHDSSGLFAESFGLTPGETKVLEALMREGGVRPAAGALGMSVETARWHAKNICAKTGHAGVRKLVDAARANDLSNLI